MKRWTTTLLLALAAAGCGGGENAYEGEGLQQTETALAEAEAAREPIDEQANAGPTAEQVPIPADFIDEAMTSIDETNYGEALDAIEDELAE